MPAPKRRRNALSKKKERELDQKLDKELAEHGLDNSNFWDDWGLQQFDTCQCPGRSLLRWQHFKNTTDLKAAIIQRWSFLSPLLASHRKEAKSTGQSRLADKINEQHERVNSARTYLFASGKDIGKAFEKLVGVARTSSLSSCPCLGLKYLGSTGGSRTDESRSTATTHATTVVTSTDRISTPSHIDTTSSMGVSGGKNEPNDMHQDSTRMFSSDTTNKPAEEGVVSVEEVTEVSTQPLGASTEAHDSNTAQSLTLPPSTQAEEDTAADEAAQLPAASSPAITDVHAFNSAESSTRTSSTRIVEAAALVSKSSDATTVLESNFNRSLTPPTSPQPLEGEAAGTAAVEAATGSAKASDTIMEAPSNIQVSEETAATVPVIPPDATIGIPETGNSQYSATTNLTQSLSPRSWFSLGDTATGQQRVDHGLYRLFDIVVRKLPPYLIDLVSQYSEADLALLATKFCDILADNQTLPASHDQTASRLARIPATEPRCEAQCNPADSDLASRDGPYTEYVFMLAPTNELETFSSRSSMPAPDTSVDSRSQTSSNDSPTTSASSVFTRKRKRGDDDQGRGAITDTPNTLPSNLGDTGSGAQVICSIENMLSHTGHTPQHLPASDESGQFVQEEGAAASSLFPDRRQDDSSGFHCPATTYTTQSSEDEPPPKKRLCNFARNTSSPAPVYVGSATNAHTPCSVGDIAPLPSPHDSFSEMNYGGGRVLRDGAAPAAQDNSHATAEPGVWPDAFASNSDGHHSFPEDSTNDGTKSADKLPPDLSPINLPSPCIVLSCALFSDLAKILSPYVMGAVQDSSMRGCEQHSLWTFTVRMCVPEQSGDWVMEVAIGASHGKDMVRQLTSKRDRGSLLGDKLVQAKAIGVKVPDKSTADYVLQIRMSYQQGSEISEMLFIAF